MTLKTSFNLSLHYIFGASIGNFFSINIKLTTVIRMYVSQILIGCRNCWLKGILNWSQRGTVSCLDFLCPLLKLTVLVLLWLDIGLQTIFIKNCKKSMYFNSFPFFKFFLKPKCWFFSRSRYLSWLYLSDNGRKR